MFKKILRTSVFLLINSLESVGSQDCINVSVRKVDNSSRIETFFRESSITHLLGHENSEIKGNEFRLSSDEKFEIYYFHDSPIFNINKKNSELKLICSKPNLNLRINSDFSIILSSVGQKYNFENLYIGSLGSIKNAGKLFVNEIFQSKVKNKFDNIDGRIYCKHLYLKTKDSLKNNCGVISGSSVNIIARSIYNVAGSIYGHGKKENCFKTVIQIDGTVKNFEIPDNLGGVFLNANNVINQCGLICDLDEEYINEVCKSDEVQSYYGLNNIHGKIIGKDIFIKSKNCDLDCGIIDSESNIKLNTDSLCSEDSFAIRANNEVLCQVNRNVQCNPKIYARQLSIDLKRLVTNFELGTKTDINCGIVKISGEANCYHKIKLLGQIASNLLSIKKCKIIGNVKFKVGLLDLTDHETILQIDNLDHEIKEIHAKPSETKFMEEIKVPKAFVYLSSDTEHVYNSNTVLNDLTIVQAPDAENSKLAMYGDIVAKNLTFKASSSIVGEYYKIPLSVKSDSFTVASGGLSLKGSNIETSDFHVATREEFAQLYGGLKKVKNIFVEGAGLIVTQSLSCDSLTTNCGVLWVANDIDIKKIEAKTEQLIFGNDENKRVHIKLQENSSIETVKGDVKNVEIDAQGSLRLGVSEKFKVIPGIIQTTDKILVEPSKIHSKDVLTIDVGSNGHFNNVAGILSSDKKIHQQVNEDGKIEHVCVNKIIQTIDEKKNYDLTFWEKYIHGGSHYYNTITTTPVPAKLNAPEIEFIGGYVKLESTEIPSNCVIKGEVDTLETSNSLEIIEKQIAEQKTKVFWSTSKNIETIKKNAVKFVNSNINNIKENNRINTVLENSYEILKEKSNRELTLLSRSVIMMTSALTLNYMVGSILASQSPFVHCAVEGFVYNLTNRGGTSGISFAIGDKNWSDDLVSNRALIDLVAGSVIQGVIAQAFNGQIFLQRGDPSIKNHFDFSQKITFSDFMDWPVHVLSVTETAGDVVLSLAMGEEVTFGTVCNSFYKHELASLSKCFTNSIGSQYNKTEKQLKDGEKKISYICHKIYHFGAAAGYQALKLAPELYFSGDKYLLEKLVCASLGGGLGAATAEISAELYYNYYSKDYLRSVDKKYILDLNDQDVLALKLIHQRAAFYGKFSSIAVGLSLGNHYSLNASYESGCRAINHNWNYSFERFWKNAKDGAVNGAVYFVVKNGAIIAVTCVNPAAGLLLAEIIYVNEMVKVGETVVYVASESYKAYSTDDAKERAEIVENLMDNGSQCVGGCIGYVGMNGIANGVKAGIDKAANQAANHVLNEVANDIRCSKEFSQMFKGKSIKVPQPDGGVIKFVFNDQTKFFEQVLEQNFNYPKADLTSIESLFNKNSTTSLNPIKAILNKNTHTNLTAIGGVSVLNELNPVDLTSMESIFNSNSTTALNSIESIFSKNGIAALTSMGDVSDLTSIESMLNSFMLVDPLNPIESLLNDLNPIESIFNKNSIKLAPNLPISGGSQGANNALLPAANNKLLKAPPFKSNNLTVYNNETDIAKSTFDKAGLKRMKELDNFKNYPVKFNETGDIVKIKSNGRIMTERESPLSLHEEMINKDLKDLKQNLINDGYTIVDNNTYNTKTGAKGTSYDIKKDGEQAGSISTRLYVESDGKITSKLELHKFKGSLLDKITYTDPKDIKTTTNSKETKTGSKGDDKK